MGIIVVEIFHTMTSIITTGLQGKVLLAMLTLEGNATKRESSVCVWFWARRYRLKFVKAAQAGALERLSVSTALIGNLEIGCPRKMQMHLCRWTRLSLFERVWPWWIMQYCTPQRHS